MKFYLKLLLFSIICPPIGIIILMALIGALSVNKNDIPDD
jgi:hypothetical protein